MLSKHKLIILCCIIFLAACQSAPTPSSIDTQSNQSQQDSAQLVVGKDKGSKSEQQILSGNWQLQSMTDAQGLAVVLLPDSVFTLQIKKKLPVKAAATDTSQALNKIIILFGS